MGRSPKGVSIGVSGDAQMHRGAQPWGQVPLSLGIRVTQLGASLMGPSSAQQSCPGPQQPDPQQVSPVAQLDTLQAGIVHPSGAPCPAGLPGPQ